VSAPFTSVTTTFVDVLVARALDGPHRIAVRFVASDGSETSLTRADLDRAARAVAARLRQQLAPGDRALLAYPSGLDFVVAFCGCLYGGVVAVPAFQPRANARTERIETICRDARVGAVLTSSSARRSGPRADTAREALGSLPWIETDAVGDDLAADWRPPEIAPDSIAFLQYTSGSTAVPQGVAVSHGNIVANEQQIESAFRHTEETPMVSWLPLYHDMGLLGGLLQPLYAGLEATLMSPLDFVQRPLRWLAAISRYRGHTSGAPNFAYDLCVARTTPEQRHGLDLSSWRIAFNGAEPVRHETLQRFAETFAPHGFDPAAFLPVYGLAEATLFVSGGDPERLPATIAVDAEALEQKRVEANPPGTRKQRVLVGCGWAHGDERIVVVDPETRHPCAPGQIGEIWVSGSNVALGYWGRADETEAVFRARLADGGDERFLRTGDLGFVAGRIKDMIIVAGRNHFPQDIELTVEHSHELVQRGGVAAFSVDEGEEEWLVVVAEVSRTCRPSASDASDVAPLLDATIAAIRRAVVEEHDVEVDAVVVVGPATIPKTSSGKIRRRATRAALLERSLAVWRQSAPALAFTKPPAR
jgi:acyl-CoA synthetase (AMP-forming)/AMP-acid ligase II